MDGPNVVTVAMTDGTIEIPVGTTDVAWTPAINLRQGEYFAVAWKATSDGNVKLKLEYYQSFVEPSDGDDEDTRYASNDTIVASLDDELWHIDIIEPYALPYLRFKITGLGAPSANDASTTIQIKVGIIG